MAILTDLINKLNGEEFSLLLNAVTSAVISDGYPENRAELIDAIRTEAKQRGDTHLPAVLIFAETLHDDDAAELAVFCDGFIEGQDSGGRECLLDYWETLRSTFVDATNTTDAKSQTEELRHSLADLVSDYLKASTMTDFNYPVAVDQVATALAGNFKVVEEMLDLCHRAVAIKE